MGLITSCVQTLKKNIEDNHTEILTDDNANTNLNIVENKTFPVLKKGINLPKKDSEWETANGYFKSVLFLNGPIKSRDLKIQVYKY